MKNYCLYYNQKRTYVSATSFEQVYMASRCWYTSGTILFIEDVNTKEIRKFIVGEELYGKDILQE